MKTLDNVNLFAIGGAADDTQDPLYPEYLEMVKRFDDIKQSGNLPFPAPDAPTFEGFKKGKKREQAIQTMTGELDAGNVKKAYEEGFTQLPIGEQLLHYINPFTGVPIETYETGYFTDQAGLGIKTPKEMLADVLNPTKNIFQKSFVKADDPLSAAIAPLSAIGALGGIAELANIPKAGLMMLKRMNQKTMDGGGGGIGGLPEPKQETTKDLAGTYSKTLEEAKAVSGEMSPQALLQYMKSNKRTNPSNNKTGTALTQSEINEIDFSAFEEQYPNKDYTNEDILQYIDDNRIQLYRVSRAEDNPTYFTSPEDGIEFELDEPLTKELKEDSMDVYFGEYNRWTSEQLEFMQNNFPDGVNKQNYDAFAQRQRDFIQRRDVDTSGQAPSQLTQSYLANSDSTENPFSFLGEPQYDVFKADGSKIDIDPTTSYEDFLDALDKGYTLKLRMLETPFDGEIFADKAATKRVVIEYEDGIGDEAYRYITDDGDLYEIIGNDDEGYFVKVNGEFDSGFADDLSLDEAKIQISQQEGIGSGVGRVDDPGSEDNLIDVLPEDVIRGNATIPTQYGEGYDSFRLPMGGATNYQEHTIHVENPKTATRYSYGSGTKHFGGGDELFHYRTTVRIDENGKKVLFVEEIQSDLHSTARSTQTPANYELPAKEQEKIVKQLKGMGLTEDGSEWLYKNKAGEGNLFIDTLSLPYLSKYIKEGRTENFGSNNANVFVESFGFEKAQEIGDLVAKLQQGQLPDFPYKGNAWVDAVTKDAMKLGAELDVDRVAFTNAATQMDRNNKILNYVQDRIITKLKTLEEIKASDEYAADLKQNIDTEYKNFLADVGDAVFYPEGQELPGGALTKEQWLQTEPSGQTYDTVLDEITAFTTERQISLQDAYGQYRIDDVGYRLEGDEILNPQRIQMEGDDYDMQRIGRDRAEDDKQLLAKIPEKFREQVKKDLAAGKKEITLNIDDLEGSGKKFLEIYKNGIIRGINKSVKDLKVDAKPDISNILYASDGIDSEQLFSDYRYLLQQSDDKDEILDLTLDRGFGFEEIKLHKAIGIDLTSEMKQKLLADGYASMYMGGKVTKSNSMDRPIEGNRREM